MAAADVDVGYIAGHLGLDQPAVAALTTEPTVDLVSALLQAVAAKAHEFDTLYAEKLQTDIELENAVRSSESRSQTSRATADKALKDVEEARRKLKEEETKSQTLENELQVLKSKNSDHAAEVKALSDQIETVQSSNRTNLSIIESNNKRDQTVTEELTKQNQRNVELSREITALQQSEQNAKGQLNSAKYREESLKQQLELALRNAEWLENELKTKSEEGLKHRKERGARIAELQRESEDARSQVDALKRTEQQLRERLDAMQAKHDEALVKLQKQEGSFATTVQSYKQELEDQRRLVDMSDQLSKKHQARVRELDAEKDRLKDNYENEIRRVRLELEQERQTTTQMEEKIQQLETDLEELQVRMDQGPAPGSVPQTPRANGSLMARAASPFGTPGSIRSKSAITATQAIDQLYQVKGQLAGERRRNQQLSEELDNMILALEAKAPEIQELQAETDTLRNEIARMSELSQQSFEERDAARKAARQAKGDLASARSEAKISKTQLRDLSTQIQMLVFNIFALEKGMDQLTEDEKFRLQQLERGEITEEVLSDMSDTDQFITQKLVVFKDIKSLQAKNEELMRIIRELSEQIQSEEALAAKHKAKVDHDKVEKLQRELEHMTEESRSIKNTMESYKTERDMFRRILQQRGAGGDEASMMRSSLDGSQRLPLASIEGDQSEALNEALRKLQSEYDNFRDAQNDVRRDMRAQIDHLSTEKNSLQTERVKLQGDLRIESERRGMLQSNYVALQGENVELQKRSQSLSETAAKQDIRTQQVAEELIEARGLLDSMRNETANLKAEKKLWKDIQDRMSKDNESLIEEKNRLNHLLATQQFLENERNMSESEARRKAQTKIEALERELSDAQRKLSSEAQESKKLQLRKEFEAKESQKRIDELMASLSQIREEHVSVKTTKDHLQARVDELTAELRSAEERAGRLQPRPTPRPGSMVDGNQQLQELEAQIDSLNDDVSDLKRDLDMANTQLENAKAQAEQYKELSQGNEEALEDLRASQGQYQQEMESLIEEKDAKIKELGQRIEDVSAELSQTNSELSTLRDSRGEVARKYEDDKAILEDELKRLKEDSARHVEAARYHQQDLRAQADIATKAQQDYEVELVKHADAAKLVQQLRADHNELKSQTASLRAEAESAKVTLAQSESSWEDRRQRLEQEMAELTTRREDVNAQNKLLHQQLEGLTSQVAALQQNRGADADVDESMSPVDVGDALEGLRELNGYLRREKEILEVQYDLKSQESRRLQQQVEYVQSQLDEARLKLDQERTQSSQGGRASMAHQDLMEKLNELNLYRESSAALRNENSQLKDQVAEKSNRVEEMERKVQPLEAEIETLNSQKTYLEDEVKQIQEDRDRWRKRTEGILTKYGRVDPAEMESLKQTIEDLEKERNALKEGEEPLRAKVTELESTLESEREAWQTTRTRLTEQFKERSKRLTSDKNENILKANQLQQDLDQANGELEGARKQAQEAEQEKANVERQVQGFKQQVEELRQRAQQGPPAQQTQSASAEVVTQLEQQLADARKELEAVNAQKLGAEQQLATLRTEMQTAVSERDDAKLQLQNATTTPMDVSSTEHSAPAEATGGQAQNGTSGLSEEERKALEERIAAAEAKAAEFEEKANEVEAKIQQTVKERCDKMRDALNGKLKDHRTRMEDEFKQKDEDLKLRFEQEKLNWQAENQTAKPAPAPEQPPSTPAKPDVQAQSVPATPATGVVAADLTQLDDAGIRQFLSSNATVKSIISANIKKKLEAENARIKDETEAKIASARDQAQLMESKKSTLRINMTENKLKLANTKLGIVETAARETPQQPVVEVWEVVKKVKNGPGGAAPGAAPGTPVKPVPAGDAPQTSPAVQSDATPKPATSAPAGRPGATAPADSKPAAPAQQPPNNLPAPVVGNPFAASTGASRSEAPNPFVVQPTPATPQHTQAQSQPHQQLQPQQQAQGVPKTGIPMPRGGGRGRGGAYVPPGQRAPSGSQDVGAGHGGQAGRGRGRGNFNPVAADFQPGSKRPRNESEGGRGAKRPRGGGGGGGS
ncbi:Nucleoprotein TPR [Tolypocladium ophioglossoides CBS 100239]|uniref:Nucleoprotein TPR n=1 Tax=Tolypocladium ophioglossoides (strain CBS 100239) TaxID=1163406 RepID=A0A0L0N3D6_TOLOC|nr:Nucleoprotein TPR [Tolypocladium ophioglossoides CBS 100239]